MLQQSRIITNNAGGEEEIIENSVMLTLEGLMNVEKNITKEIVSEKFVAKDIGEELISGVGAICINGEGYVNEECIVDSQSTNISNGISITINTKAVSKNSRILVTFRSPITVGVTNVDVGKSFTVSIKSKIEEAVVFDWFIIDSE